MKNLSLICFAASLLVGCASSGPAVMTNVNPDIDLGAFQTYNFMQPLSTDRSGARTQLSTQLMNATSDALAARGLQQSDNPDVLVNFFVNTEERMDVRQTPTTNNFHRYRMGRYSGWPRYTTTVRQFTQGTLSIDLVDPTTNILAAEGVAQGRLRTDLGDLTQEHVDEVVSQVMAQMMPPPE